MIHLIKRVLAIIAVICLCFTINVCAENSVSLTPDGEFYIYGQNTPEVAKILGMGTNDLRNYCDRNEIIYLAVSRDNSKQIRISEKSTDFSNSIINITGLSDDKIESLIPDIIGIDNVRGEIAYSGGQKHIKTQLRSKDSGGDFILTEYYTVADRKCYILSFYTNADSDTDYIENTFKTYDSPYFIREQDSAISGWYYVIIAAIVVFALCSVFVVITIIKDIKKEKNSIDSEFEEESKTDGNSDQKATDEE